MDCRPRGNHNFFYASNPDNYLVPDNAWPFFKQFALPSSSLHRRSAVHGGVASQPTRVVVTEMSSIQ